jgi:hypothetical protein
MDNASSNKTMHPLVICPMTPMAYAFYAETILMVQPVRELFRIADRKADEK